jgi:hypothetical protein
MLMLCVLLSAARGLLVAVMLCSCSALHAEQPYFWFCVLAFMIGHAVAQL